MTKRDRRVGFRVSDDYVARNPEADPSATELVINVFYTAELLYARMDRLLKRFDVSRAGFNVLQIVSGAGRPVSPTEISDQLIVTTATVTGVTDTLVRAGLVARTPDPDDRRRVRIEMTPGGTALLDAIGGVVIDHEKAWAAGLDATGRERLIRDLGTLQTHLRELPWDTDEG